MYVLTRNTAVGAPYATAGGPRPIRRPRRRLAFAVVTAGLLAAAVHFTAPVTSAPAFPVHTRATRPLPLPQAETDPIPTSAGDAAAYTLVSMYPTHWFGQSDGSRAVGFADISCAAAGTAIGASQASGVVMLTGASVMPAHHGEKLVGIPTLVKSNGIGKPASPSTIAAGVENAVPGVRYSISIKYMTRHFYSTGRPTVVYRYSGCLSTKRLTLCTTKSLDQSPSIIWAL